MYPLGSIKYNVSITHRFLEVVHTHNERVSMQALIERRSKNVSIFIPDDWVTIIKIDETVTRGCKGRAAIRFIEH